MKRICIAYIAAGLMACLTGGCALDVHRPKCDGPQCQQCCDQCAGPACNSCRGCCGRGGGAAGYGADDGQGGPPTGAVTYPYYTTRGPRDYFVHNPESVGP